MPAVILCDADLKTPVEADTAPCGWGSHARRYSPEAQEAVDAYFLALKAGAAAGRAEFNKHRVKAALKFHKKYPDGKLPDEA